MKTNFKFFILYLFLGIFLYTHSLRANNTDSSVVQLTIGFPAGGTSDIIARQLADDLSKIGGKKIIIKNKPGAGGLIALKSVANNKFDQELILQLIFRDLYHDQSIHDVITISELDMLKPVAILGTSPLLIMTHKNSNIKNIDDIKHISRKLKIASSGPGGVTYSQAKNLEKFVEKDFSFINYRTASQAYPELYRGDIDLMIDFYTTAIGHASAGEIIPIAVINSDRLFNLNQIPTILEQGMPANNLPYFVICASPGTNEELIEYINKSIVKSLSMSTNSYSEKGVYIDVRNSLDSINFYKKLIGTYRTNE
jgi:tripartite-type tricarboxylate transporter receptor subunit TctC